MRFKATLMICQESSSSAHTYYQSSKEGSEGQTRPDKDLLTITLPIMMMIENAPRRRSGWRCMRCIATIGLEKAEGNRILQLEKAGSTSGTGATRGGCRGCEVGLEEVLGGRQLVLLLLLLALSIPASLDRLRKGGQVV